MAKRSGLHVGCGGRGGWTRAVPLLLAGSLWACSDTSVTHVEDPRQVRIRLTDLLDVAEIESPLLRVPAARNLDELTDVRVTEVFFEDFEEFDPEAAGWSEEAVAASEIVASPDPAGGHALKLARRGAGKREFRIPAEPNTHYVFERSVRTSKPLAGDFEVLEIANLDQPRLKRRSTRRSHWVSEPETDGSWQRSSVSLFTMSYTEFLNVVYWETPRRFAQLDANDLSGADYVFFDDLRVLRIDPTPEQEVTLFKAAKPAPDADPALGMRKHGQFPPLVRYVDSDRDGGFHEGNYTHRYALYVPPPTTIGFALELGPRPALRFSYCLSSETRPGDACRFEVLWKAEGGETTEVLWSRTLRADAATWRWHEERVELLERSGQRGELVLATRAETGHPHPLWGNPFLEGPLRERGPRLALLIAVDTLRADRLSCYGYERETSPRLDALAQDGIRFEHVVSNATWTCPSFASIFTGQVPSRHGVWVAGAMWARVPESFETLAERFRAAGWATEAIAYKSPLYASGYDQGFDVSLNSPTRLGRADANLARALEWLDDNGGLRSFLFLHFDDPHEPYNQPEEYMDRYASPTDDVDHLVGQLVDDEEVQSEHDQERTRDLYDGEIAYVDDRIGRFLDELDARGLYDDALIVFVSDHGEELWEHGQLGHSSGKLFDEGTRIPLIVKPAGTDHPRGRVVRTQVRGFDVMPTLLELAGITPPTDIEARTLVPLLTADGPDRLAVTETLDGGLAIRTPSWKYISRSWREKDSTEALFDLTADPGEHDDVAVEHPERLREMRRAAIDYLMQYRPGRYLVAIQAEPGPVPVRYRLRGIDETQTVYGRWSKIGVDGNLMAVGSPGETLALVLRLTSSDTLEVLSDAGGTLTVERYEPGRLERLLDEPRTGLWLFEGPEPAPADPIPRAPLDPEQLEALRALGYIGR